MTADIYSVLTFLLSSGVAWASICRLNALTERFRKSERAKYVVMLGAATALGLQGPLLQERAGVADVIVSAGMLAYMLLGMWRWKHGAPKDAERSTLIATDFDQLKD